MGEAYDTSVWLQKLWEELTGSMVVIHIVFDSPGMAKNISTSKLPVEKRLRIDLAVVRQILRRG
jgi:hypothetical protein